MPSCKVTHDNMTLFIDVKGMSYNSFCLDITLSGLVDGELVDINGAMAELLKRKSDVRSLRREQSTTENYHKAMCLIKQAAETMIKEDIFDLLFMEQI